MQMASEIELKRCIYNEFNEQISEEFVAVIKGQYYKGSLVLGRNSYISNYLNDSGKTGKRISEKFLTIVNEDSEKIQAGDRFELNGVTYEITDLGKNFDVYFDFSLERL